MAVKADIILREAQFFALRDTNLLAHQINTGNRLGDRMLDLQARIHLNEIKFAVLIQTRPCRHRDSQASSWHR